MSYWDVTGQFYHDVITTRIHDYQQTSFSYIIWPLVHNYIKEATKIKVNKKFIYFI